MYELASFFFRHRYLCFSSLFFLFAFFAPSHIMTDASLRSMPAPSMEGVEGAPYMPMPDPVSFEAPLRPLLGPS